MQSKGQFVLKNGVFADRTWTEHWTFDRYSWYQEMSLFYDLIIAQIPPQSSFNFWFSEAELKDINSCVDFRVAMIYTLDSKKISHTQFYEQMEFANYQRVDLSNFKKHLQLHPDSTEHSLQLYQIYGFCKKTKDRRQIVVNFPGFVETLIK